MLAACQLLCWAALYYGFSSFVLPMQSDTGWTKPQMMGAFTVGLAVWGAATYAVGAAIDRGLGRRMLTAGALLAAAGFVLWSRATTLPLLYAAWAVLGAAMAMTLYEPAFTVLTKRFPVRYRDGITALTLVGGFASTLSFPVAAWLIATMAWRDALLAIAVVLAAVVAPLHAWVLRGPPEPPQRVLAEQGQARRQADATLHEALRHRAFWLLTASFTLHAFAAAALWAHLMPAFAAKGHGELEAIAYVVWFGPAQVAGRLVFVLFGRRLSTRALGLVVLAAVPVAFVLFALADRGVLLIAFAVLFGVANGLITIVRGGLVPEVFGRTHVGRISDAMSGISLLARAAAPLLTAWLLLALPGGYRDMLLVLAGLSALAVVSFAVAPRKVDA